MHGYIYIYYIDSMGSIVVSILLCTCTCVCMARWPQESMNTWVCMYICTPIHIQYIHIDMDIHRHTCVNMDRRTFFTQIDLCKLCILDTFPFLTARLTRQWLEFRVSPSWMPGWPSKAENRDVIRRLCAAEFWALDQHICFVKLGKLNIRKKNQEVAKLNSHLWLWIKSSTELPGAKKFCWEVPKSEMATKVSMLCYDDRSFQLQDAVDHGFSLMWKTCWMYLPLRRLCWFLGIPMMYHSKPQKRSGSILIQRVIIPCFPDCRILPGPLSPLFEEATHSWPLWFHYIIDCSRTFRFKFGCMNSWGILWHCKQVPCPGWRKVDSQEPTASR